MTAFDPLLGQRTDQEHEHDVLLVAGSAPEVARLAPVATAFASADRIRAVTVATGIDPMAAHEAYLGLGVPPDITLLPATPLPPALAAAAAWLMTRIDQLLVDLDPSAVVVHGGGITATVTAQVAFWRQIPVVHLQAGIASDDLLCPFPQEANRRVIGQLASMFLTTTGTAMGGALGPNAIPCGDTIASNPMPGEIRFVELLRRIDAGTARLAMVGVHRACSTHVVGRLPELLAVEPDVEVVLFGPQATDAVADERVIVAPELPFADLVRLLAAASLLISDDPDLVADAPGFGTPAVFVDGSYGGEPGDAIHSSANETALRSAMQVLAAGGDTQQARPEQGGAAARVEHAVAWMFGLTPTPEPADQRRSSTDG